MQGYMNLLTIVGLALLAVMPAEIQTETKDFEQLPEVAPQSIAATQQPVNQLPAMGWSIDIQHSDTRSDTWNELHYGDDAEDQFVAFGMPDTVGDMDGDGRVATLNDYRVHLQREHGVNASRMSMEQCQAMHLRLHGSEPAQFVGFGDLLAIPQQAQNQNCPGGICPVPMPQLSPMSRPANLAPMVFNSPSTAGGIQLAPGETLVGSPRIMTSTFSSYSAPTYSAMAAPTAWQSSATCDNPNCANPNCPNRQRNQAAAGNSGQVYGTTNRAGQFRPYGIGGDGQGWWLGKRFGRPMPAGKARRRGY